MFRLACIPLVFALAIAALPAQVRALGGGSIDQVIRLAGHSCQFNPYINPASQEAQVSMSSGGVASTSSGGNYWLSGRITSWPGGDITSDNVASLCGISDISNFVSDGANGTFALDDFMGIKFRGKSDLDDNYYDYVFGLSGSSETMIVNSRNQVDAPNTAPTADAGADQQVTPEAAVTLDGSASDPNDAGQSLTYAWRQTGGPDVTLSGDRSATPGFTAPELAIGAPDVVLIFELVVNDGLAGSAADSVEVMITAPTDEIRPTVSISGAPSKFTRSTPFSVTIKFSEPVVGLKRVRTAVRN